MGVASSVVLPYDEKKVSPSLELVAGVFTVAPPLAPPSHSGEGYNGRVYSTHQPSPLTS